MGGKAHDIAMDSDEEAEMLEQAIQRSLVYSSNCFFFFTFVTNLASCKNIFVKISSGL